MNIDGHAAIVTGGGSGLGAETARRLAAEGARVAVLDSNVDGARAVAEETGGGAFECDVSDAASTEKALRGASDVHGVARILVNCAGTAAAGRIVGRDGPLPLEQFSRVVNVNLVGTFNVMRLFAAALRDELPLDEAGERGVIVNTASVAAFDGQVGQAAYGASKGGVASLTLPVARDLASAGIRVMTIAPGLFATPMLLGMDQELQDSLAGQVPFPKRFGKPAEYAELVVHICRNQMLNGEVIRLDGAIRMQPK